MSKYVRNKFAKKNDWGTRLFLAAILAYPLLLFAVFYVAVNINSVLLSFQHSNENFDYVFNGVKELFSNYEKVFADFGEKEYIRGAFANSFLRFVIVLGIGMPLNMLFAFYIYKKGFGCGIFRVVVMLPTIISGVLMGLMFQKFVNGALPDIMKNVFGFEKFPKLLDPSNDRYAFGVTTGFSLWVGFSTAMIIYPNAMSGIEKEILESAQIDGAGYIKQLWYIVIPMIMPTVNTFVVTGTAGILTDMGSLYLFYRLSAPPSAMTMGYYIYQQTMQSEYGQIYPYVAALGILCTLISFPITMAVKYLTEKLEPPGN